MKPILAQSQWRRLKTAPQLLLVLTVLVGVAGSGCSAFSPAFLGVIDPTGANGLSTLPPAPGFVIVTFANNATVDEQLINYLVSEDLGAGRPGILLSDIERRSLRPRLRFRLLVTFLDGTDQIIEFVSGSRIVDPRFAAQSAPDLDQLDLTNTVLLCDVARVEFLDTVPIEVFMPVEIQQWRFLPATDTREDSFRLEGRIAPVFRTLTVDTQDQTGNIGVRDVPASLDNPRCGALVTVVVEGVLRAPFLNIPEAEGNPSFDLADTDTAGRIGGRYVFTISVQ